jgi:hypothetical protein
VNSSRWRRMKPQGGTATNVRRERRSPTDGQRSAQGLPPDRGTADRAARSKGPITDRDPSSLWARACAQGWEEMCGGRMRDFRSNGLSPRKRPTAHDLW